MRKLLGMGLVPARVWGGQAGGISLERLKLRRQMAAAGKKESVSLSFFKEVNNLVVEEDLSTMATLFWKKGVWRQVRLLAGAVMCETRALGIKWLQWNTLMLKGKVAVDMRVVCPQDVKKCFYVMVDLEFDAVHAWTPRDRAIIKRMEDYLARRRTSWWKGKNWRHTCYAQGTWKVSFTPWPGKCLIMKGAGDLSR